MKRISTTALLLGAAALFLLADRVIGGDDAAPDLSLVVEVDDQTVNAVLGQPFEVTVHGKPVRMRISADPNVHFDHGGLQFDYPRHMAYELDDETPEVTIWTLDGNNLVLMVEQFDGIPAGMSAAGLVARELIEQFGRVNTKQTATTMTFGDETWKGKQVIATIAGSTLTIDLFDIPGLEKNTVFVIQDTLGDDGQHSKEWSDAVLLLKRTMKVNR